MKITKVDFKPKKAVIKIEETQPYFLNSIRRVMISELPKLAVDGVVIYDNTSALFDEIISQRLGMIPIPTDLSLLIYKKDCTCKGKGCPSCTVRYTLSKEGNGTVYSGDLQPAEKSWAITEDKIPIVDLYGEQRLILEIEAVLGIARTHAKWQAVHAPAYRMDAVITFDKDKIKDVREFINKIPEGIAELKGDKIIIKDEKKIPVFESYIDKKKIDFIYITRDPTKVTFSFETDGSMHSKDAIIESAKILEKKYKEFGKLLKDLK